MTLFRYTYPFLTLCFQSYPGRPPHNLWAFIGDVNHTTTNHTLWLRTSLLTYYHQWISVYGILYKDWVMFIKGLGRITSVFLKFFLFMLVVIINFIFFFVLQIIVRVLLFFVWIQSIIVIHFYFIGLALVDCIGLVKNKRSGIKVSTNSFIVFFLTGHGRPHERRII